jgi:hypothetical protein
MISIQPVRLQALQPLPPQSWHETSTSAEGSVKGKKEGGSGSACRAEEAARELGDRRLEVDEGDPLVDGEPSICSKAGACEASNGSRR